MGESDPSNACVVDQRADPVAREDSVCDSVHDVLATSTGEVEATERCAEGGTSQGRGVVAVTRGRRLGIAWHAEEVNGWVAGTLGNDKAGP